MELLLQFEHTSENSSDSLHPSSESFANIAEAIPTEISSSSVYGLPSRLKEETAWCVYI